MKRSIRFAEDLCIYHSGAVLDTEGVASVDLWYQYADLQRIKRKALVLTKESGYYGLCSYLTNTYGKTDTVTMEAIITWAISCAARRGLERFLNQEYAAKRYDIRRRTIKSVLTAQRKLQEEGIKDAQYTATVLSRLSVAFSQDSSRFAHVMGIGDEAAAEAASQLCFSGRDEEPRRRVQRIHSPHSVLELPLELPETSSSAGKPEPNLPAPRKTSLFTSQSRGVNEMRHFC